MPDDTRSEVKQAIVRCLRLSLAPEEIRDDVTLFGSGLGLDSIDALELVIELERRWGVRIEDEQTGRRVLRSVDSIVEAIEGVRARSAAEGGAPA